MHRHEQFEIDENNSSIKYDYSEANWHKFRKHLNDNNADIPSNRNLTTDEIDKYIERLNTITNSIDHAV